MFALQPEMKVFSGTANRELAERICKYIGVPITAKLIANLLCAAGVNRVLTMDLHAQQVQGFFDIPVDHLYSLPVLIKYLRQMLTGKTVVVSPDIGGLKMASAYAEALGANL